MPTFPIPVFAAAVLGFLFVRLWRGQGRLSWLAALVGLCGVQALIIALAQHYAVPGTRALQPVMAAGLPGLAWMAFQSTARRPATPRDVIHAVGPALILGLMGVFPPLIDPALLALYLGYGAAILWAVARSADDLPQHRLEAGDVPRRIWQVIGVVLIASALGEVVIIAIQIAGLGHLRPWFISLFSMANLILIGGLSLSDALGGQEAEPEAPAPTLDPVDSAQDAEIMARLSALMTRDRPYLDPDLTLTRLARRLSLPVKQLSSAINRTTGENVSRYINAARVAAAQQALQSGETVTGAMLSAGFATKSNFNREFLRVTGQTPSQFLADR